MKKILLFVSILCGLTAYASDIDFQWAKTLTPNVQFYAIFCNIDIARKRIIERNQNNPGELFIDENCFNDFLQKYEPISPDEGYPAILNNCLE